jgi:hypothetical protein
MAYYYPVISPKSPMEPKAAEYFPLAAKMPPDYVFPFQYRPSTSWNTPVRQPPTPARRIRESLYDCPDDD